MVQVFKVELRFTTCASVYRQEKGVSGSSISGVIHVIGLRLLATASGISKFLCGMG